ncbi:MAG: PD-(D/E)XK nuclease family protein [Firmicutes bacterium]|nr:PD-(D/E)XK nuclease family protein [Bacillota bacterium]
MSAHLYLGSPVALFSQWLAAQQGGTASIPTIVAHQTLARFASDRQKAAGRATVSPVWTVWDYAKKFLPDAVVLPPIGFEQILAQALPAHVLSSFSHKVPGLDVALIRAGLECRRYHVSEDALKQLQVPWAGILPWLDQVLSQSLYDTARLFSQAADVVRSSAPQDVLPVNLLGIVEADPAMMNFLDALSEKTTVTMYTPWMSAHDNRVPEKWRAHWAARHATIQIAAEEPAAAEIVRVPARPGQETREVVFRAVQEEIQKHKMTHHDMHLVLGWGEEAEQYAQMGRQWGIPLEQREDVSRVRYAKALWQTFLHVAQGQAPRAEVMKWLEAQPEILVSVADRRRVVQAGRQWQQEIFRHDAWKRQIIWARQWWHRIQRAESWSAVARYVEEAVKRHQRDSLWAIAQGAAQWAALDAHHLKGTAALRTAMLFALAPRLPLKETAPGIAWEMPSSSRGLSARVLFISGVVEGRWPRSTWGDPLLPDALRRQLGMPDQESRRQQDLFTLQWLIASATERVWLIGGEDADGRVRWPEAVAREGRLVAADDLPDLPLGPFQASGRSARWYASHRDLMKWDSYGGIIAAPRVDHLLQRPASPSTVELFGRCPYAYFLQEGLGLRAPYGSRPDDDMPLNAAQKGQWVHDAMERLSRRPPLKAAELWEQIEKVLAETEKALPEDPRWAGSLLAGLRQALAAEIAEGYLLMPSLPAGRRETEKTVEWAIPAAGDAWHFQGRLDRLDEVEGAWVISDYKTGKVHAPQKLAPDNMQLLLYHWALAHAPDAAKGQAEAPAQIIGMSTKNTFRRYVLEQAAALYPDLEEMIGQIKRRIAAGLFFPVPIGQDSCRACAFRLVCPQDITEEAKRKAAQHGEYVALWQKSDEKKGRASS